MGMPSKYREQFDRVQRWYSRFETINNGTEHRDSTDNFQDEVYAFFLNCYHLKDWIRNDPTVGSTKDKVEQFIDGNDELKLCGDICNGNKHLNLKKPRSGQDPKFGRKDYALELGEQQMIAVKYTIDTTSGPLDAFELATKCLDAWRNFITNNNI